MLKRRSLLPLLSLWLVLAACTTPPPPAKMLVSVVADGLSSSYEVTDTVTVEKFLQDLEIPLGELDRVNPPLYTQISDQMKIEIVRIQEESYCEERDIPYRQRTQVDERLTAESPGVQVQAGINGQERVCYRVEIRNGVRQTPVQTGDAVLIREPQDEISYVPPPTSLDPVEINGTIAYLSKGNAWIMRGSSQIGNRRSVTTEGDLDDRVFSLSEDGRQLLFARHTSLDGSFGNQLWLLPDVTTDNPQPVQLRPENILYATWYPGESNTITYTTAEPRSTAPGWDARNDLRRSLIDPQTGDEISIDLIVDEYNGGLSGWWGTRYSWSPDGTQLAYAHADAVGIIDLATGERLELVKYADFTVFFNNWSWRTTLAWSPDSRLLVTTTHGASPSESIPADRSPVFNVAVVAADGSFTGEIIQQAGIWSVPSFSPFVTTADNPYPGGHLAYMLARQPLDSVNDTAEYDLYVADRDGSNARRLFPPEGQVGILTRDYTWSPDGRQLAVVYQGNLWIVEVDSGLARQVTLDGSISHPVWTR